ncbi:MAG: nucleotidyltransferase domain-containing protein [Chloroflexi bacterium]|nr:nucleotidyltransferase domain-containing protein [Chloroflexota bacterium]
MLAGYDFSAGARGKYAKRPSTKNGIDQFCQRWDIRELAFFGSALRDDFRSDSDFDILVTFAGDARWGLFDHVRMEQELEKIFGRSVDLITRRGLENSSNWLRREEILNTALVVYPVREAANAT